MDIELLWIEDYMAGDLSNELDREQSRFKFDGSLPMKRIVAISIKIELIIEKRANKMRPVV